jgi:uncharacterized protein YceK
MYRRETVLVLDSLYRFSGAGRSRPIRLLISASIFVEGTTMKADVGKWAAIVFLSVLVSGCSSIRARTEILDDKEWTVYPGVRQDVKEMGDVFSGERPGRRWLNGVVASILVLDLPFSAVFDTMAAPYDWYRIRNPKASGPGSFTNPTEHQD